MCQQICLPSIISNATDHKNEIWKTVKLTSSYSLYSPSQSSVLDSLSTIKHSNFQIILAHQEAFCLPFCSTASEKGRFTREAIDYWRPMGRYITTLRCLVVPSESKNIPNPCSQNLKKLANLKPLQSLSKSSFKMDAKTNDHNEHEQKKSPLTSTPLFSRPNLSCFLCRRSFYFHASS